LEFATDISRPIVVVGYNVQIEAAGPRRLNGALLLDRDSVVLATTGPFTVGHVSYWCGGSANAEAFRVGAMPQVAEQLAPRVVYVASTKEFL
jgi:hypothetical protein